MAKRVMNSGTFRESVILKSNRPVDPDKAIPVPNLPTPISSDELATPKSTFYVTPGMDGVNGEAAGGTSSPKPKDRHEDHYGFLYSISEKDLHYEPVLTGKKARDRENKWLEMLDKDNWDKYMKQKKPKIKERCRKGIPPSLRGRAWQQLSESKTLLIANAGLFDDLVSRPDNDVVLQVIDRDLDRTFPSHVLFSKPSGQLDLRNVLKAYAMYNKKTGYCQAMAPVAATLLMHMTPEESFWLLVQICEQYLPGYYSPGLHAFQIDARILMSLLDKYLPETRKFMDSKQPPSPSANPDSSKGLDPILYCTEWFMSLFSRSLPWNSVLRVWDMFFFEGPKVLFKVALSIINLSFSSPKDQKEIKGFFELTRKLRNLPISVTHENVLVPEILKYHIHQADLHKCHISQASVHFTEERVREMELAARRLRLNRRSVSIASEAPTP